MKLLSNTQMSNPRPLVSYVQFFFPNFLFDTIFFINAQLGSIIRTLNVKGVHLHEHFTDISGNMM